MRRDAETDPKRSEEMSNTEIHDGSEIARPNPLGNVVFNVGAHLLDLPRSQHTRPQRRVHIRGAAVRPVLHEVGRPPDTTPGAIEIRVEVQTRLDNELRHFITRNAAG